MFKISIAVCTYNGEKHLREQLESYAAQTRLPDEVTVCDDVSSDSTREILKDFAKTAAFPFKIYFNEENLGHPQNFSKAAGLCTGDIIVFSDQDDVWRADKLELIEAEFSKSENVGVVYADAEVVDENLQPFGKTMWECCNFNAEKRAEVKTGKSLDLLLRDGYLLGSSMACSSKFRDLFLPIPTDIYYDHDDWIALIISAFSEVALIDETLIKYRQHPGQTSAGMINRAVGLSPLMQTVKKINKYDGVLNQLIAAETRLKNSKYHSDAALSKITAARKHFSIRASLPKNPLPRLFKIGRELLAGHYHAFSNGYKSATKDLLP